jgi:CheY-like chemotaxis protein
MVDPVKSAPIAVLDDDVQFIRMIERVLGAEDIPVQPITTPDLHDAVRVVESTNCRAALVDIYIYGEAAGFELIELLRANPPTSGIPLIVTSGAYRELARRTPFLQHHGCSVLPKPFEVDALLARVSGTVAIAATTDDGRGDRHELSQATRGTRRSLADSLRGAGPII